MKLAREKFGDTSEGKQVDIFTIANESMRIKVMSYGASLVSVEVPDRNGNLEEITLGFDEFGPWEGKHPFFGTTVGRFGNRIAGASFEIDGEKFSLPRNDGKNHLHGGPNGFNKKVWETFPYKMDTEAGVKFCYTSRDGEEGYPGNLDVTTLISLSADNRITFEYRAVTDRKTPVNLTNHTYWNLRNKGTIYDHLLTLSADDYLEVNNELIPTGRLVPVRGTPFDFTSQKRIGELIEAAGGFDHCFVLRKSGEKLPHCATVIEPSTGRIMKIYTNQPGVQFYSANSLKETVSDRRTYKRHGALCLETQGFPDSVHHSRFPSAILSPGEEYHHLTVHEFSVDQEK